MDDNVDAAAVLAAILTEHGHEVVAVTDGMEAISTFEGFRPQVVLLDIGMPGMNGLEIARRLRERAEKSAAADRRGDRVGQVRG